MERKILQLSLSSGLENENNGSTSRASKIKNLISKNGANCKRQGWRVAGHFKDESGEIKINGIFPFNENQQELLIVHAGTRLYKCSADLSEINEISTLGFSLQDRRSQGVIIENKLWIFGVGEPLVYDGALSLPTDADGIYVPKTRGGITDIYSGDMYTEPESPNILTSKRINSISGKDTYRTQKKSPVISLDGDILWGSPMDIEVKIRVREYGDGVNETTSIYRGVDSEGKEANMVVTAKYHLDKTSLNAVLRPSQPLVDEIGRQATIKTEDETHYTYNTLPWIIRITGQRQLTFDFDIPSPTAGQDNIVVTYHSPSEAVELANIRLGTITTTESGQDVAVFVSEGNMIRYTDYKMGTVYIPETNKLQIGNSGVGITAIVPISGGYLGAFSENGFYKIKLPTKEGDSAEAYKSIDKVGAFSQWCCATVGSDTLALTSGGVFGVKPSGGQEQISHLYNRSTRIKDILLGFTKEQLREAVATEHDGKFYLFIDGYVFIADSQKRSTRQGLGSSAFEYEWWLWDGCSARVVASAYNTLYMGREDGAIAIFYDGTADIHERSFSQESLTLAFSHDEEEASVFVASRELQDGLLANVSPHRRRIASGICYLEDQLYSIPRDQLYDENGNIRVYEGDYYICKKSGAIVEKIKVLEVDPRTCTLKCQARSTGKSNYLFMDCDEKTTYTVKKEAEGFSLRLGGKGVILKGSNLVFSITERKEIECEIVSCPISLGDPVLRKNLWGVYVKPTKDTTGEIEIEVETLKGRSCETIRLDSTLSFDSLDFGALAFKGGFDRAIYVPFFERGVNYLTVALRTKAKGNFGIEGVYLCYTQAKKIKGEG